MFWRPHWNEKQLSIITNEAALVLKTILIDISPQSRLLLLLSYSSQGDAANSFKRWPHFNCVEACSRHTLATKRNFILRPQKTEKKRKWKQQLETEGLNLFINLLFSVVCRANYYSFSFFLSFKLSQLRGKKKLVFNCFCACHKWARVM